MTSYSRVVFVPIVLGCMIVAAAFTAAQDKPSAKSKSSQSGAHAPAAQVSVWRSLTTGRDYRISINKSTLVAEWINQPAIDAKSKASVRSELHKSGTKWVGITRSHIPCRTTEAKGVVSNVCDLTTKIEIETMATDKIMGHGDSLKRFDCGKCNILETKFAPFQWVPKK